MIRLVVCDWNKTLTSDPFEHGFFTHLAKSIFLENILNPEKLIRILLTVFTCNASLKKFAEGKLSGLDERKLLLIRIIESLNRDVINGIHVSLLNRCVKNYSVVSLKHLDLRLVRSLNDLKRKFKICIVVISSGYSGLIEATLRSARFNFDFVIANSFQVEKGIVRGFVLGVYANKVNLLRKIMHERGINSNETVFIGDDVEDEECFRVAGFPIVPFHANEVSRHFLTERLGAFSPSTEEQFTTFIRELCS